MNNADLARDVLDELLWDVSVDASWFRFSKPGRTRQARLAIIGGPPDDRRWAPHGAV